MDDVKKPEMDKDGSYDDLLVERFKGGDKPAFDELYNKYKTRIIGYLYRFLGDRMLADEVAQEAFIHVYTNIWGYKPVGMFRAWLYKIASNLAKNELKKRARRHETSLDAEIDGPGSPTLADMLSDEHLSPETIAANDELKAVIEEILKRLPDIYREVMVLCVIEGLSYEEAAEALSTNVKTVSSRLARARELFIGHLNKVKGMGLK